jgi:hypothetical protein
MYQRPDAYSDDIDEPLVRPVKLVMKGRGLPPPPLVPLVAALGIVLGLGLGFGFAPHPAPAPTLVPVETAAVLPSAVPDATALAIVGLPNDVLLPQPVPPTDGLSLVQALSAFAEAGTGIPPHDVLSARVVRLADVLSSSWSAPAGSQWVWAISVLRPECAGVQGGGQTPATPVPALPTQNDASGVCAGDTTRLIILDYHTGAHLAAFDPAP